MPTRRSALGLGLVATTAAIGGAAQWLSVGAGPAFADPIGVPGFGRGSPMPMFASGNLWLNSPPISRQSLRGKVVLVNFWTYSCINSLRPLPYLRDWAAKYQQQGLAVIGIHTPEFAFETDEAKVRRAVQQLGIRYPVGLDSRYETWRRFGNQGWPGFFFVDALGNVRHQRLGEGDYDASERLLQKLLSHAGGKQVSQKLTGGKQVSQKLTGDIGTGIEKAADWANLRTPETYVGTRKAAALIPSQRLRQNLSHDYGATSSLRAGEWALGGKWTAGGEFASADAPSARIAYHFHARDLHMVLGGRSDGRPVPFRVTVDGGPPGADSGVDVRPDGLGAVTEDRLYQLVRQSTAVRDRTFEIEFLDSDVRAYAFTFG